MFIKIDGIFVVECLSNFCYLDMMMKCHCSFPDANWFLFNIQMNDDFKVAITTIYDFVKLKEIFC